MSSRALACRKDEDPQGVLAWFEGLVTVIKLTIRQPNAGRPKFLNPGQQQRRHGNNVRTTHRY